RERALDLERRDPDAADLEHVVGAARVSEEAVGVAHVAIAGARPRAVERREASLALVPVARARRWAAHPERALFAVAHRLAQVVQEFPVVAGAGLSRSAVAHVAVAVRDEDVEHLGRADAVEDVAAEPRAPFLADVLGERLAGRDARAEARRASARF